MASIQLGKEFCEQKGIKGMSNQFLDVLSRFLKMFNEADVNNSGVLEMEDVKRLVRDNEAFSAKGVQFTLEKLDKDKSGTISKDEYARLFILSWAKYFYEAKFASAPPKVEEFVGAFVDDGYKEDEVRKLLTKKPELIRDDGTVEIVKFVEDFFDICKSY